MIFDRVFFAGVLGCSLTLVLTGCGNDEPEDPDNPSCVPSPAPKQSDFYIGLPKDPIAGYLRADRETRNDEVDMTKFAINDVVYYSYLTLDPAPNAQRPNNASWLGGMFTEPSTQMPIDQIMGSFKCGSSFHEAQKKIQDVMDKCAQANKMFIWSIGGPDDLTWTMIDSGKKSQVDAFVEKVLALLKFGGDGVDLSFEHLSHPDGEGNKKRDLMKQIIPALRKKLDENDMKKAKIVYTGKYNCFQEQGKPTPDTFLTSQDSDGECLDALNVNVTDHKNKTRLVADMVDWVNLQFYDAERFKAINSGYFHMKDFVHVAQSAARIMGDGKKVMVGMKPGLQAGHAVWEGFEIDFDVVGKLKGRKNEAPGKEKELWGLGGMFIYNMNDETPHDPDSSTPYSFKNPDLKALGKNARYLGTEAKKQAPDERDILATYNVADAAKQASDELPAPLII